MRLRAVPLLLALTAALTLGGFAGASAQGRAPGFGRGGGAGFGGRPFGFAGPGYGYPYRRPPPPYGGYGRPPYDARGYPPPPAGPTAGYGYGSNWRQQQNEVRQAVREGRHVPLGRAIDAVQQRMPGHELDADLMPGPDGRDVYRLRWAASNGRRMDFMVDAATGAVVGVEGAR